MSPNQAIFSTFIIISCLLIFSKKYILGSIVYFVLLCLCFSCHDTINFLLQSNDDLVIQKQFLVILVLNQHLYNFIQIASLGLQKKTKSLERSLSTSSLELQASKDKETNLEARIAEKVFLVSLFYFTKKIIQYLHRRDQQFQQ